jgi:hypothetical protein
MENWQKTEMKIKRNMSSFFHTNFFRSMIRRAKPLSYWLIVFLLWTNFVHAADWYVSTSGTAANPGTISAPKNWAGMVTIVNNGTVQSGDRILFKRGDAFTGVLNSGDYYGGTAKNNITFSSYGTGAKPRLIGNTRTGVFHIMKKSGWVWDGLNFQDVTFSVSDKLSIAPCATGIRLGNFGSTSPTDKMSNNTIKNCDFNNIGLGIVILGDNNLVDSCSFVNLKNVVNTIGGNEDYGANGITLAGSNNSFLHGYYESNWCESYDFGFSGGANEMFGACVDNLFAYNTYIDCGGIAEYGSQGRGDTSRRNKILYNKIINCGSLTYINFSSTFVCVALNNLYYNNVFVENSDSRFSGVNAGAGITTSQARANFTPDIACLAFSSGSPAFNDIFTLKNNIFWLANPNYKVANNSTVASKTVHTNNVYRLLGTGSTANYTLDATELTATSNLFINQSGAATLWNYQLLTPSIARDAGTNIGGTVDFAGLAVTNPPNIGIYEDAAPSLIVSNSFTPVICNGGTSSVTVTASGGTPPYFGTGIFTRTAGLNSFTVTDGAGVTSTTTANISQPPVITPQVTYPAIACNGGTTTVTVTATGGTGALTGTGTFTRSAGAYSYTITDASGCSVTTTGTITQPTLLVASSSFPLISFPNVTTAVTVSATGGTTPYTGTGLFSRTAGAYSYTVTDANGCTSITTGTIPQVVQPVKTYILKGIAPIFLKGN